MKRLRHFLSSMVGRLFVILLGMAVAAIGATMLATSKRQQEFERQNPNASPTACRATSTRWTAIRSCASACWRSAGRARALQPGARLGRADTALMEVLEDRPGPVSRAHVHFAVRSCIPKLQDCCRRHRRVTGGRRANATRRSSRPRRAVDVTLNDGTLLKLALDLAGGGAQRHPRRGPVVPDPAGAGDCRAGSIVARMASAPLQELAAAAEDLGDDLQRDPLPLRGPHEVQRAAEAFNAMQHRWAPGRTHADAGGDHP